MNTINLPDLQFQLSARRGAMFVSIVARTDARLKKTDNPLALPVWKVSRVNGVVNFNYASAVNRQRGREFDEADGEAFELFEPEPRKWGVRLKGLPFVQHKDQVYLEMKVERSLGYAYEDNNGNPLTNEQVEPFLPKASSNADHQGVDREIILRDYNLKNILQITFLGETYNVDRESVAVPMPGD
jgi:hypothetical protein